MGGARMRTRRQKAFFAVAAAVAAAAVAAAVAIYVGGGGLPGLGGGDAVVKAGQKVVVTVTSPAVEDMYGYQFEMRYDGDLLAYDDGLSSKIDGIQTIFAREFDGYQLVGATMIGEREGFTGEGQAVCELAFQAKVDQKVSDLPISLGKVGVVTSGLEYKEGVEGWTCAAAPEGA
jgi:hypothetical protein